MTKGKPSGDWLERMRALLGAMDNPQDAYPIIHIGGTAGKGSTATIAAKILQTAGYKTGLHTSPHLEDIRERAIVNGVLMDEAEFVRLTKIVKEAADRVSAEYSYGAPTYFESLVALSFQHFKDEMVDVAVVEVGLGGKLDATNIVKSKVAVLTNVGLDHTEILGDTVEKIAADKVCIFKEGTDVVSGVTQPSVIRIVEDKAAEMNCRLDLLGRDIKYFPGDQSFPKNMFDLEIRGRHYDGMVTGLIGEYQIRNSALAIDAVSKMEQFGFAVSDDAVRNALLDVVVPGRFEIIGSNPTIILDGAHNEMKMKAFIEALEGMRNGNRLRVVFAAKRDKDVKTMISILSEVADKFYFTKFQAVTDFGKRMSFDPLELQKACATSSAVIDDAVDAYKMAFAEAGKDDIICITGSLYLVGEIRSAIVNARAHNTL
jgi:dihydrofolate synthase/folylpolyglutamate synthase